MVGQNNNREEASPVDPTGCDVFIQMTRKERKRVDLLQRYNIEQSYGENNKAATKSGVFGQFSIPLDLAVFSKIAIINHNFNDLALLVGGWGGWLTPITYIQLAGAGSISFC